MVAGDLGDPSVTTDLGEIALVPPNVFGYVHAGPFAVEEAQLDFLDPNGTGHLVAVGALDRAAEDAGGNAALHRIGVAMHGPPHAVLAAHDGRGPQ